MNTQRSPHRTARAARIRDAIHDQPPSAKLVAKSLELDEPLTQGELMEETLLARRTVRFALTRLEEQDVLHTQRSIVDGRKKQYKLKPPTAQE